MWGRPPLCKRVSGALPSFPTRPIASASFPSTRALQMAQRHQAHQLPHQGFPRHRHPIRQTRPQLPRRLVPRHRTDLLVYLSPHPRSQRIPLPPFRGATQLVGDSVRIFSDRPLPNASGRSCHSESVRTIHSTPSTNIRLSRPVEPR